MLWTAIHDLKDSLNKAQRYGLVKKIAHGVHKDDPRCTPLQWVINQFGMEGDLKAVGVTRVPNSLQAESHTGGLGYNLLFCWLSSHLPVFELT